MRGRRQFVICRGSFPRCGPSRRCCTSRAVYRSGAGCTGKWHSAPVKSPRGPWRSPFIAHPLEVANGHALRRSIVVEVRAELEERQALPFHRLGHVIAQVMQGAQVIVATRKRDFHASGDLSAARFLEVAHIGPAGTLRPIV